MALFSQTRTQTRKDTGSRATKQGHEQRKKSPSKRAEGSRKERADWIKNEAKEEIADEERRRGNHFFSNRVRGAEYQKKAEESKRILTRRTREVERYKD